MTLRKTATLFSLLLCAACTVGPNYAPPAPPSAKAGYGVSAETAAFGEGGGSDWWTSFGNADLDALVQQALAGNHSLAASRATLDKARQQVAAMAGRQLPQVDANARAEYERVNLAAFGLSSDSQFGAIPNPQFDLYTLGGGVSYDLDLFGRNRRTLEHAAALAEAEERATEAAHLLIAGRVVEQVLAIAAANDRLATEQALIAEDERNVSLTRARNRAGEGTQVEVLSAEGQLANDRADLPGLEQQLAEGRAMLAVLLGISPQELGDTSFRLDAFSLPTSVPVALPSALIHVRPDIREAEARLHAAVANVGVATANLYPDITLGASTSQASSELDGIFSNKFNAFDIFAGLSAPIFHGGTLKAEKRGAEADARAAAAQYREVVIEAFGQISGLLSALGNDGRDLSARETATRIAEHSLRLSRRSFEVGNSGVLQVLDSNRSYQHAQLALVEARSRQFQNIARLHAATAGGWIPAEPHAAQ